MNELKDFGVCVIHSWPSLKHQMLSHKDQLVLSEPKHQTQTQTHGGAEGFIVSAARSVGSVQSSQLLSPGGKLPHSRLALSQGATCPGSNTHSLPQLGQC